MINSDSDSDSWLVATTPGDSDSDSAPLRRNAEAKICGRRIAYEEMRDEEMPDEDLSGHDFDVFKVI